MLGTERQSARMPKITNDGLTRSGAGCFIAVPISYVNSGRQRVKQRYSQLHKSGRQNRWVL